MPKALKQFWKFRNSASGGAELLLYGEIESEQSWWDSGGEVYADAFVEQLQALGPVPQITVRINSVGGDIFAAIAIYTELKTHGAKIVCIVDGLAASAASLVLMAGDEIQMPNGAMVMIHDPLAVLMGSYNSADLAKSAGTLDAIKESIVSIYAARTGMDADDISDMMAGEKWMGADEAIENGFADKKIDEKIETKVDMKGKVIYMNQVRHDLSAFSSMPELEHAEKIQAAIAEAGKSGFTGRFVALANKITGKGKKAAKPAEEDDNPDDENQPDDTPDDDDDEEIDEGGSGKGSGKKKNAAPARVKAAVGMKIVDELPGADAETHARNVENLETACPNLVAAIRDDAALEERQRLQEIDALAGQVDAALIDKAKYTEPSSAQELAYEAMQASTAKGSAYLAARARAAQTSHVKNVKPAPAAQEEHSDEETRGAYGELIAGFANARLGSTVAGR